MLDQVPFGRAKLQYLHLSIISYFHNLLFCVTKCLCGLDVRLLSRDADKSICRMEVGVKSVDATAPLPPTHIRDILVSLVQLAGVHHGNTITPDDHPQLPSG